MLAIHSWPRLLAVGIFALFTAYTILLYGRPAWLPAPPRPWDEVKSAGQTEGQASSKNNSCINEGGGGWSSWSSWSSSNYTAPELAPPDSGTSHPIDGLIDEARTHFKSMLGRRSLTLAQAASRYRERRQRHPPPGFDAWWEAAQCWDAVVVEDFFDRIYDDVAPLWALDPATMRRQTRTQPQVIRVRNGTASFVTDNEGRPPWIQHWTVLVQEIAAHLPDLDMVVNVMDETRLLVPWEKIGEYVAAERASRKMPAPGEVTGNWKGVDDVDEPENEPYQHPWITNEANRFWDHLRAACPPDSPARNVSALTTFDGPVEYPATASTAYTRAGYVANATAARDPCLQPHLRGMHGTFIESVSMSTSHELLPMFAGCKLPQNNEILIPGAMYLTEDPFYSGGEAHGAAWADKRARMVWRGTASGGRNKVDNWWHFHRHRWVQMANGSTVAAVEGGSSRAGPSFALPAEAAAVYDVPAQQEGRLGGWLDGFADVGFVDLECFPLEHEAVDGDGDGVAETEAKVLTCGYTSPHMAVVAAVPMREQYDCKFLPDVDGNSYSARWRSFLRSSSLPLKATIYAEWHDDRLVAWAHYAPLDSSYVDLYGVMDYFLGGAHGDAAAQRIADEGRRWAEAVLRREDMRLYVWRLLLEYARVVDDGREHLGYVGDLVDG
ncbi:capsule associated protein [Grosmannia clavigera kw1407]|uniref:Capsule associated protein n=1 Tax=Grosmannia clavigera (strain kw1407 / UAMH 11150) TaxID=655863 RepID=F0XR40_GROCL|nr:capsule associated protein [Grosmannia clavigera kw1407]EFW99742.1 capsule associated protein [Grosmannia clavigera kw1407]